MILSAFMYSNLLSLQENPIDKELLGSSCYKILQVGKKRFSNLPKVTASGRT